MNLAFELDVRNAIIYDDERMEFLSNNSQTSKGFNANFKYHVRNFHHHYIERARIVSWKFHQRRQNLFIRGMYSYTRRMPTTLSALIRQKRPGNVRF